MAPHFLFIFEQSRSFWKVWYTFSRGLMRTEAREGADDWIRWPIKTDKTLISEARPGLGYYIKPAMPRIDPNYATRPLMICMICWVILLILKRIMVWRWMHHVLEFIFYLAVFDWLTERWLTELIGWCARRLRSPHRAGRVGLDTYTRVDSKWSRHMHTNAVVAR